MKVMSWEKNISFSYELRDKGVVSEACQNRACSESSQAGPLCLDDYNDPCAGKGMWTGRSEKNMQRIRRDTCDGEREIAWALSKNLEGSLRYILLINLLFHPFFYLLPKYIDISKSFIHRHTLSGKLRWFRQAIGSQEFWDAHLHKIFISNDCNH